MFPGLNYGYETRQHLITDVFVLPCVYIGLHERVRYFGNVFWVMCVFVCENAQMQKGVVIIRNYWS